MERFGLLDEEKVIGIYLGLNYSSIHLVKDVDFLVQRV
jgi:hypothetical protein